jgi:hypothetical protein
MYLWVKETKQQLDILKRFVPTSQKTHYAFNLKSRLFMMFKELTDAYCDNLSNSWRCVQLHVPAALPNEKKPVPIE